MNEQFCKFPFLCSIPAPVFLEFQLPLCIIFVDFFVVYILALAPPQPRVIINLYYEKEKECK